MMKDMLKLISLVAIAFVVAGCDTEARPGPSAKTGAIDPKVRELYMPDAQAGVSVPSDMAYADMDSVFDIAQRKNWSSRRSDAFSLLAAERRFDQEQMLERLLNESGGFSQEFEFPDESGQADTRPQQFPTPAWRLAGIVVSEGAVIALLDQGGSVDTIVPGQPVSGTEWRCVSIDTEKAVFRRDSNRVPSEIVVPLQAGLPGQLGGGNAPTGGPAGGRSGGNDPRGGGGRGPDDEGDK
ncbi:hypothetical protein CCB80_11980 [Armatimonadetes bacterium Uphvl-Ar1]|nr:hypothetical protein CCB80_11980 [Armatimonadetes bacterium Uphvl-Ar1]